MNSITDNTDQKIGWFTRKTKFIYAHIYYPFYECFFSHRFKHISWKLRLLKAYRRFHRVIRGLPRMVNIEPISRCMLDCEFCMLRELEVHKHRKSVQMTFEQFKKIIDEVAFFDPMISFNGGEPLLHKDIFKMISYARSKNLWTQVNTNAVLLAKNDNAKKMAQSAPDEVLIAYEALDKDTYETIRRKGDYEGMLSGIKQLVESKNLNHKIAPIVVVQMVLTKKNRQYEEMFWQAAKDIGADYASIKALGVWPEGSEEYEKKMIDEYIIPMDDHPISRHRVDENGKLVCPRKPGECPAIRLSYIGSGGEVLPCCWILTHETPMGNVFEDNFVKIWNSTAYKKQRHKMLNDWAYDLCHKCIGTTSIADIRKVN